MISFLGLVCVVLKCLKELQQHGLLVATHSISSYVQYRHTMKKACEKISTYLHTMYIPQSLVIKHACQKCYKYPIFPKKFRDTLIEPIPPCQNTYFTVSASYKIAHFWGAPPYCKGYCLHLMMLLSWCKSLIQCTQPSLFGIIKLSEAHSLSYVGTITPIFTR